MARASALQAVGQGFKSPNLQRKLLFDITRDGNDKQVRSEGPNDVKQQGQSPCEGVRAKLGARGSAEWRGLARGNMAKRMEGP